MNYLNHNKKILTEYFQSGCKKGQEQKLGLEVEHFIVFKDTKESVPYSGDYGIQSVLEELLPYYEYGFYENNRLLGMESKEYTITLEPAAQLEISISPQGKIRKIQEIYQQFLDTLEPILERREMELVTVGYQPKSRIAELELIPKKRYDFMNAYFQNTGTQGTHMMRGTASAQVSIDYTSEEDFIRKIRATYILMPAIKFLTDCTPVYEGRKYEKRMARTMIWKHVDEQRCGIVPELFSEKFGFEKYADFLMKIPLIFRYEEGVPVFTGEKTVQQLWKDTFLEKEDIEHVLSMVFPDVRLKKYLEIRGADSMPLPYVLAYVTWIKSVFFHEDVLDQILNQKVTEKMILQSEESLTNYGYEGVIYGKNAQEYLQEMITIGKNHLEKEEQDYLLPLEKCIQEKRSLKEIYEK